jgi:hypothetical protein
VVWGWTGGGGLLLAHVVLGLAPARAGGQATGDTLPSAPLADNSFLIEEAYNQERGVVQHIGLFVRDRTTRTWLFTFTQEWPAWSHRHQLSYMVPVVHFDGREGSTVTGVGDLFLNYRYQLVDRWVAIAPRLSLLLPTGTYRKATGAGGPGVQVALPLSASLAPWITVNLNAGATLHPSARSVSGYRATTHGYYAGASLILFLSGRVNALVEGVRLSDEDVMDGGGKVRAAGTLASVGIRWGHDLPGGVQVVPGIAWAIGRGASRDAGGLLVYLSVEHAFRKANPPAAQD